MYDAENVFAKILKAEIPCKKIYEDDTILSFYDIHPKSKVHALVIPKMEVVDFSDFVSQATPLQVADFFKKSSYIASEILNLKSFRLLANNGKESGQEVFHFHLHILGWLQFT